MNIQEFQAAALAGEIKFTWVDINDEKVCPDCFAIAMQQEREGYTWLEWEAFGLPKSGHTVCEANCRCALAPVTFVQVALEIPPASYGIEDRRRIILNYGAPPTPQQLEIMEIAAALEAAGHPIGKTALWGKTFVEMIEYLKAMAKRYRVAA